MSERDNTIIRLVLSNGMILDKSECGFTEYSLWCFLKNMSMAQAFKYFSDAENYKELSFDIGIRHGLVKRTTYKGLTDCVAIEKRKDQVDVKLIGTNIEVIETSYIDHDDLQVNQEEPSDG